MSSHLDTSRQSRPGEIHGKDYFFDTREQMEADISAGKYIEHGEYRGNLYGTSVDGIRDFAQAGYQPVISPHYQVRWLFSTYSVDYFASFLIMEKWARTSKIATKTMFSQHFCLI